MSVIATKRHKQNLGQYFTPPEIVDLAYDFLEVLLENEKERWENKFPSVIDPACGEGIFLKKAIERNITQPKYVFGIDIDENIVKKWEEINLLKSFGSEAQLKNHFFHQNGLIPLELDSKNYPYIKGEYLRNEKFDLVVGNPPFGGIGVDFGNKINAETQKLIEALQNYELIALRSISRNNSSNNNQNENKNRNLIEREQSGCMLLFEKSISYNQQIKITPLQTIRIAKTIPIEVLFVERFIKLCKDGGHIAIIVPDGILSNSKLEYVRRWIKTKCKIEAIISLPRETFKHCQTTAKTSLLILTRVSDIKLRDKQKPIFLAAIKKREEDNFEKALKFIGEQWKYFNKHKKLFIEEAV